ncbi:MAG: hypothetical protein KKA67_03875 [Spirochaetes bacterium]|nr:hypothetical protein [Spirochaetota bacterium]MBU1079459.1 hypothetical protein [Spirochaetota bacterium]
MDTDRLMKFIGRTAYQVAALDAFVEEQRGVAGAVRARDWPRLEKALERAAAAAEAVSACEADRTESWHDFLAETGLPPDSTVFRASLSLPLEYRSALNDAYRALRLSAMRARIENDTLSGFVGSAASTLRQAMEALFPERKGRIYGKSGRAQHVGSGALILDTAL